MITASEAESTPRTAAAGPACLLGVWFEQFDRVARRIVQQDLVPADAGHQVVPEMNARLAQRLDHRGKPGDLEGDAVPAAGLGLGAIGHGLAATAEPRRRAEQQAEIPARQHGERWRRVHLLAEAEVPAVEV